MLSKEAARNKSQLMQLSEHALGYKLEYFEGLVRGLVYKQY